MLLVLPILVLQLLFTYAPPLQGVFGSESMSADEWLRVLLAGVAHAGVLRTTPGSSPATALRAAPRLVAVLTIGVRRNVSF